MNQFRQSEMISQSIWAKAHSVRRQGRRNTPDSDVASALRSAYVNSPKRLYYQNSQHPIVFPTRTSVLVSRYFAYRLLSLGDEKRSCIDHGVAGGIIFFDSMLQNYEEGYIKAKNRDSEAELSDFLNPNDYDHQMHFSFKQLPLFAYIADCIINHNIWSASLDSEQARIIGRFDRRQLQ